VRNVFNSAKSKIPNVKTQITNKFQIQITNNVPDTVGNLQLGIEISIKAWILALEIYLDFVI